MFKVNQQHRYRPKIFSSLSRDRQVQKSTKRLSTRLKPFLPTSLALSLCFFLYVTVYSKLSSIHPPFKLDGGSEPSTNYSKMAGPGPSKQLASKPFVSRLEKGIETLDEHGIPFDIVDPESGLEQMIAVGKGEDDAESGPVSFPAARRLERPKLFQCGDISQVAFWAKRGPLWVLHNYLTPTIHFACDEAVTYTTHADYTYLDNLVPLLERWQGPISLSLYAPGTDLDDTLGRVHYLRECSTLVKDFVSFHLMSDKIQPAGHLSNITTQQTLSKLNCSMRPKFGQDLETFRKRSKLMYPVNVGRNVAREMAPTHYVLASDIELYPSGNLMADFLEMIQRESENQQQQGSPPPSVFVLPIFEVDINVSTLPNDKMELIEMLEKRTAVPFHKNICSSCHTIPRQSEWMRAKGPSDGLHVFHVAKRQGIYKHWEPFYIGTKSDPKYDERLSWEGQKDKMTQAYILCVLDYEFHILDNAFLVHRPGIKRTPDVLLNATVVVEQKAKIKNIILPQLVQLYGIRPGCYV